MKIAKRNIKLCTFLLLFRESIFIFSTYLDGTAQTCSAAYSADQGRQSRPDAKDRSFFLETFFWSLWRCNPRTNKFHHLLWQPKRLQKWEEHRRVSQTTTRCRRSASIVGATFRENRQLPPLRPLNTFIRRVDVQPLVARLSKEVKLPVRPVGHPFPALPRRTAPITTLPRLTNTHMTGIRIAQEFVAVCPLPAPPQR